MQSGSELTKVLVVVPSTTSCCIMSSLRHAENPAAGLDTSDKILETRCTLRSRMTDYRKYKHGACKTTGTVRSILLYLARLKIFKSLDLMSTII